MNTKDKLFISNGDQEKFARYFVTHSFDIWQEEVPRSPGSKVLAEDNKIILCRPAVRKARVAVIRKILKKMKILKACKLETVKEKNLKKCERLFEKVKIMKKVKDDEVTKFALLIKDLDTFFRGPNLNLRQSALAYLAKHEAVTKKINFIRELVPNWETELPVLLNSLGKSKKKRLNNKTAKIKTDIEPTKHNARVTSKNKGSEIKKSVKGKEIILQKIKEPPERKREFYNFNHKNIMHNENKESRKNYSIEKEGEGVIKIEKIDDPFFVKKKVIASKLILKNLSSKNDAENFKKTCVKKDTNTSVFHKKSFKTKKDSYKYMAQEFAVKELKEKLHPSWAAKKKELIKPFEGTLIKFSDE